MKNNNLIESLKRREATEHSQARTNYRKLVEAVAEGRAPNAKEAAEILSNAGHSAGELEHHAEMARSVNAQRERVAGLRGSGPGLRAQLSEAVEAMQRVEIEKTRALAEFGRRVREANERVSHLRRTLDRESRAASELAELERELAKQLGEAVSEPKAAPEPKASFSHTPGREDLQDKQPVLGPDGKVRWEPIPGA